MNTDTDLLLIVHCLTFTTVRPDCTLGFTSCPKYYFLPLRCISWQSAHCLMSNVSPSFSLTAEKTHEIIEFTSINQTNLFCYLLCLSYGKLDTLLLLLLSFQK